MSSAGQANEAGSIARRSAASYFGVYMLAGMPVETFENFKAITHLEFESPDPTDDIVLTFGGGGRGFVSSKREVTYGKSFKDTVEDWVAQLDESLGNDDLLILVCEECAGWVRDLADALAKLRSGSSITSKRHRDALGRLDGEVPPDKRPEVYRRARILELPRLATNNDSRTLLAVLMNQLVEGGAGATAVSIISERVHEWAGRAHGFDAQKLVAALSSSGVVVLPDANGSAAGHAAATQAAMDGYLAALSASKGRVDLSFLADDLDSFVVDDLLENVRVVSRLKESGGERDVRLVLRRYGRMLMVGQPGAGKSLTMRELAGWVALDEDAPVPVPVHLPELLPCHQDQAVTVDDLVALAATRGPELGRDLVEGALRRAVENGDALLLLDGLDECRDWAPWMVERLKTLVDEFHWSTAVVVATRGSMAVPAERIGLPRVDLQRPFNLDETIDAVLEQCANARVRDAVDRDVWLRARREWLAGAKSRQAGMLQVPQLALLVTLILGSSADLEVPRRRAELLHQAVRESVRRFERDRVGGTLTGAWAQDLTLEMLLDGFVVLGRLLEDRVPPPERAEAVAALSDMLVDAERWGLSGARARELASQVLTFWDTHVTVFVIDEQDRLTSRSRVFTEVATAMWTTQCDGESLLLWASEAVRFHESEGVMALALGMNDGLVAMMLELGDTLTEATLAVASACQEDGIDLTPAQLSTLLGQLGRHASDIHRGVKERPERKTRDERDWVQKLIGSRRAYPDYWPLIESLCSLKLSPGQRMERDQALGQVPLSERDVAAVAAWVALADAKADERDLEPSEVEVVTSVLSREVPRTTEPFKDGGILKFPDSRPLDPGVSDVARRAIAFLGQLPDHLPEHLYKLSHHVHYIYADDMHRDLRAAGYDTGRWKESSPALPYINRLRDRDYEEQVLRDAATVGDPEGELTRHERWALPDLAELIDITNYGEFSNPEFSAAFVHDGHELRRRWLKALVHAFQLDADRIAAQAVKALEGPLDHTVTPPDWWLVSYGGLDRRRVVEGLSVDAENQRALLDCMHASSHWIAHPAFFILANVAPTWDTVAFFNRDRSNWAPYRASECYLLCLLVSPERMRLVREAAESAEPARRRAAAEAIKLRRDLDPDGDLRTLVWNDRDMWVRENHNPLDPPPTLWTCRWCGQSNNPSEGSCSGCDLASRPGPRESRSPKAAPTSKARRGERQ